MARKLEDQFPDGVCFVGLGAVTDKARVPTEVAAALGCAAEGARQVPKGCTRRGAGARRLLLVLDNCEHLLTAAAQLCGHLLEAADDLRILATSRETVCGWAGGRYRLSPLGLPASGEPAAIAGPRRCRCSPSAPQADA